MENEIMQMGWWDWVGVAAALIGGVAFVMATPSVLQMILGKPQVLCEFVRGVEGPKRTLAVFLRNPPIKKGSILDRLRVRRETVQSLVVQFRLIEAGSNTIVLPIHNARIYSDDQPNDNGAFRIALPPTYSVASSFVLVYWDNDKSQAMVPPDRLREELVLGPGQYRAEIIINVDGTPQIERKQFVIGRDADSIIWIG